MITIDSIITFSFGSVVGFIVSELIKDRLARTRGIEAIRIVEFNKAAAAFRSMFVDDKYSIRQAIEDPSSDDQGLFLMWKLHKKDTIVAFEKAKIMFEPYIDSADLKGFNDSWINYIEWMRHYQGDYDNKEKTHEMLKHLDRLLTHANPK
jgi:hypothetical protein